MNIAVHTSSATEMTLRGVTPRQLFEDPYFRRDFAELHAMPDGIDAQITDGFRHVAAVRRIPDSEFEDMETPHGYGGSLALTPAVLARELAERRARQRRAGRVAEFIRLHPFLNPLAFRGLYDRIQFNRLTVVAELGDTAEARWGFYSKGTRHAIKRSREQLALRALGPADAALFKTCYESGLDRNEAASAYYFPETYYRGLLGADWCTSWAAELDGRPVAVAAFLAGGALAHYHLAGGFDEARATRAHYLLLDHALSYFGEQGRRWMHLGGGRTTRPDDGLLSFKTKFSPHRAAYYVCGMIYDDAAYRRLGGDNGGQFLGYRARGAEAADKPADPMLNLRPAAQDDFTEFFRLKCDIDNIAWSGHTTPPDWRQMSAWFDQRSAPTSGREILIAEDMEKVVGYAYVERRADAFETAVAVDGAERGKGHATEILRRACARIRAVASDAPIEAWIYPENIASVRAHEAAGYQFDRGLGTRRTAAPAIASATEQLCWVRHR